MTSRTPACGQSVEDKIGSSVSSSDTGHRAEEGADASTPKNGILQCDVRWQAVAVCSAVVVLVFVFVTALLVRRWSFGPRMLQRKPACDKPGCQHVASEILSRLDHSVDPCDDIEAHVCGPIKWESDLVTDTATHMMRQWKKRGALYLESKRRPHAAFALYEACMHPHGDSVSELKAFMRERGLSWPEYRSMGRHALYVLLDLLINWGVPFWFEMSLRCLPNETRYSLYINRVKMNQWRRQQQISADQGRLMQYAVQFYDIFNASQAARTRIPTLLRLEKEIHAIIEPSEKGFV
ncbi:hypothetical protein V5799_007083 [Amblyomma americanum]|uniref:Peptidase M13 N-terminal domain-containing protein n=1 Tax=Amblyomma americanum TaxID=6943 RepID=A0AAQ4DUJ4_AMBAM